jgi:hypothetical protein
MSTLISADNDGGAHLIQDEGRPVAAERDEFLEVFASARQKIRGWQGYERENALDDLASGVTWVGGDDHGEALRANVFLQTWLSVLHGGPRKPGRDRSPWFAGCQGGTLSTNSSLHWRSPVRAKKRT